MSDEQTNANLRWWVVIVFLGVVTAFIYVLIFQPQAAYLWLKENLLVAWAVLGVAICGTGVFFLITARSSGQRRSVNQIRGVIYCLIGACILLAVSLNNTGINQ